MLVEMQVAELNIDSVTRSPVIVLKGATQDATLTFPVGLGEANAIQLRLEDIPTPRPMTHDLLKTIMDKAGITLERVVITDQRDGTYYASVELTHAGQAMIIDSRPSDAIALALRANAPILVDSGVLERSPGHAN
jgi:bifunctional DNase/RNase